MVDANTSKVGISPAQATTIANTSGSNTGDQDISGITTNTTALGTKVDKVVGKELSANDYTDTEKTKLARLANTSVTDNLISTNTTEALSANQGKVLKDLVDANTSKVGISPAQATTISNTSGSNTGDQDISGIATNATAITDLEIEQNTQDAAIALNSAKEGITTAQASEITANTSKIGVPTGGITNQVLVSNGADDPTWETRIAIKSPIIAALSGISKTITNQAGEYTGSFIILPAGKWSIQINMLLPDGLQSYWLRTLFSESSSSGTMTSDVVGGGQASGYKSNTVYDMLNGTIIINNTSGGDKTYYYWTANISLYSGTFNLVDFGTSIYGENQIIAYPMNY